MLRFAVWTYRMSYDHFDRALLAVLQDHGKASAQDLADRTALSATPCWRRVKRMEEDGVIEKYMAVLDPKKLGLHATAVVFVSLTDHSEATIAAFDRFVQTTDQVIECFTITGDSDYMLKVMARDPEGLEDFIMKRLLASGVVRASRSNFVLRRTKAAHALPLHGFGSDA